jgi:drug/metabolite transporter (DMT)-like permease
MAFFIKIKIPKKTDFKWFLLAGLFGFFFYMIAFNKGCETVTASTCSVIIATVPIITALFSRIFYHEKLKCFQWIAIMIAFFGVVVLTLMDGIFMINIGLIWLFFAAIALSTYNLLLRKLLKDYSALQVSTFSIFAGTLMLTIFLKTSVKEVENALPIHFFYLVILGIFSSAIAYLTWSKAFSKAKKASTVSNYMFITPVLTTLLGYMITKEIPDIATVFGGAIILFGLLIFYFGNHIKYIFLRSVDS